MIIMVAFNWSHEPGPTTASTMPHSHHAVPTYQDVAKMLAGAGAWGADRAEVEALLSGPQLTPPRGNEGGAPHPIT